MTSKVPVFARAWSHPFKIKMEPLIGYMFQMKRAWKMSVFASFSSQGDGGHRGKVAWLPSRKSHRGHLLHGEFNTP